MFQESFCIRALPKMTEECLKGPLRMYQPKVFQRSSKGLSKKFQQGECFSGASKVCFKKIFRRFKGCFQCLKEIRECFNYVSRLFGKLSLVFHECFMDDSRIFEGSCQGCSRLLQRCQKGSSKRVSSKFQFCFKEYQGCIKSISKFQECFEGLGSFKGVSGKLYSYFMRAEGTFNGVSRTFVL